MERILSIVVIDMRIFTAIFHKADYIFFLFTVGEWKLCIMYTAIVIVYDMKTCMAHIEMFLIMWCLDGDQQAIHSNNHPAVWLKSAIVACRTRTKYSMPHIPDARRKNSPLSYALKFQKVTYVVTVCVSGFTHLIPKVN